MSALRGRLTPRGSGAGVQWRISDKYRSPKNPPVTAAFWSIASIVEIRDICTDITRRAAAPATRSLGRLLPARCGADRARLSSSTLSAPREKPKPPLRASPSRPHAPRVSKAQGRDCIASQPSRGERARGYFPLRPGVRTPIRVGPRSQVIDVAAIGIVRRGQFPDPVHSGVLRLRSSSLPL
jgi:hypothetical protein